MAGILDQHQDSEGTNFGFGQFSVVRYRGQCFTPALAGSLATLGFSRNKGSNDVKVYIDTTSGNVPAHVAGSELYSWIIPNASIVNGYGTYDLPVPLLLTVGVQYCFYLAPFSGGVYSDDYQDCHGVNSGSKEMTNNNGSWSNENLTFHYATYMLNPPAIQLQHLRPAIFKPGIAR
jgi:hypothetical protein